MFHAGRINRKYLASPTVMILELEISKSPQTFFPGQWVDFVIEKHEWTGGFSIASSPNDLPKMTLAVKKSKAKPSDWIHHGKDSIPGTPLKIKVGGNCFLDPTDDDKPAVFCAGGIGISPVLANYREYLRRRENTKQQMHPKTMFLYSVTTQDELVFGKELLELYHKQEGKYQDEMILTLTKGTQWMPLEEEIFGRDKDSIRIEQRLGRYLKEFLYSAPRESIFYICGPPAMNDEAVSILQQRDIPTDNIRYEKWW